MNNILIVGAGPGGLAMAGRLRKAGIPFDIVERNSQIVSSWRRHYDRLKLHTVKKFSHLPHLQFPKDFPKFVSKDELVEYYESYCEHFDIQPELDTEVKHITKDTSGNWSVTTNKGTATYQKVVIATGVNRIPRIPRFPNQEAFQGDITHSIHYKNPMPFLGKKVLVVGMGNTGAEIALDLSNSNIDTSISVRSKINIVPLVFLGRASQETAFTLNKLPRVVARNISNLAQKIAIGNLEPYGLEKPNISPIEQLGETGKTPVIDLGTVEAIKSGRIVVRKDIANFTEKGVSFKDGTDSTFNHIILCTGYDAKLEEYIQGIGSFLDTNGNPKSCLGSGEWEGMYFLGYDIYKAGGILGVIREESERILNHLT